MSADTGSGSGAGAAASAAAATAASVAATSIAAAAAAAAPDDAAAFVSDAPAPVAAVVTTAADASGEAGGYLLSGDINLCGCCQFGSQFSSLMEFLYTVQQPVDISVHILAAC